MITRCSVRPSQYHDSVTLMEVAREMMGLSGVMDGAAVMATEANKAILREAGMLVPEVEAATANDLAIVVQADTEEAARQALELAERHLARQRQGAGVTSRPRTLRGAVRNAPQANLAIISVPGQYAAAEAWEALRNGLHVFLFSDNVPLKDEIALKRYAADHGLLMMGPDCGTAILNGVALGFANVVPRGPVGIVAAAGTGLQEVSTFLARRDVGISQAIGTGGRDLTEAVGGIAMLEGLKALQHGDPATEVLVLISKPPAPGVARRVLEQVGAGDKPTVACFLGGDPAPIAAVGAIPAATLQEAAYLAAAEVEGQVDSPVDEVIECETVDLQAQALELKDQLTFKQRALRGLFSGGTLAAEALVVWREIVGDVRSNVPLDPRLALEDPTRSQGHTAVDLGAGEFTRGRPHPMIDNDLRIRRLMAEAADPTVAVIVLDVVLGYGAHPDPARELGAAIRAARAQAAGEGRQLVVVASVTGTEEDPQRLSQQVQALEDAGAVVASCNAAAARLAGFTIR